MNANSFLGLTKKGAQNLAEASNLIFRLVRVDDEVILGVPQDNVPDRICIVIEKSAVKEAYFQ